MASLKEIRTRISSVTSTRQVTSAMKMVSAAKLRKAQNAILQIRPYANKLKEILSDISQGIDSDTENIYAEQRSPKNVLIITITSNRGMCGAFNSNVIKAAEHMAKEKYPTQFAKGNVKFYAIGRKGAELLKHKGLTVAGTGAELFDDLRFGNIKTAAENIMDSFANKIYDRIEVIYNQFKNAGVQILTQEQFLPIQIEEEADGGKSAFISNYIFEPSKEYIFEELVPKSLKIQFYKMLLDSNASEHGARMTAMHIATDNATELIKELKISYNKARQESITNEILDIVGGANALSQ